MKARFKGLVLLGAMLVVTSAQAATELKTQKQQLSYVIGVQVANSLKNQGIDLDTKVFAQAVKDIMAGKKSRMSPEAMQAAMQKFQHEMMAKAKAAADEGEKKGKAYRDKNRKKKGVVELKSGVQYKVLKKGSGKKPSKTDTVVVHYSGKLVTGEEFDSSYKRKQPATFPVNGVIRGWQEILPMMKVGAKWNVVIPASLAYGAQGRPGIPPGSTLVFDVELVSIK